MEQLTARVTAVAENDAAEHDTVEKIAALVHAVVLFLLLVYSTLAAALPNAEFVGREVCASCHAREDKLWQGSHHDWAMKPATPEFVLGDFGDVSFDHYGEKTRLFRRDGRYWVTTDNAEGKPQTFEVKYTFGFYPLQQYLLPLGDGRLQALNVAWDSRPQADGGQRWFHLYPDEAIPFDDALHWTGPYFTWNTRCAECHSTNLQRGYQVQTDTFDTTWSEINVSCEACHGPGSRHVALMKEGGMKDGSASTHAGFTRSLDPVGQWLHTSDSTTAHNPEAQQAMASLNNNPQLAVCGSCHSRRALLDDPQQSGDFYQHHRLQLLQTPLYYGDGQVRDEVYVLGSFLQSKMHQQGVVCSNCHEPHSLKLRAEGNAVCAQCHRPETFDQPQHHHHPAGSSGAQCVNCHMPETTYMVVDPRRDHSLRIPRPDLSATHDTPNACNQCHQDRDARWAASAVDSWLQTAGTPRNWHFSDDLLPALTGAPDASERLMKLALTPGIPALVEASALAGLEAHLSQQALLLAQSKLHSEESLVRRAAVELLTALPAEQRWQNLQPMLNDSSKAVRMTVARQTADVPVALMAKSDVNLWQDLQSEYLAMLQGQQDSADGLLNLGLYQMLTGDSQAAEATYQRAIELDDQHAGAYLNLADLYRQQQRETDADATLQRGLAQMTEADRINRAALYHSLGLSQVRRGDYTSAGLSLAKAAELSPENVRYGYVYGVMLQRQQKYEAAAAEWRRVLQMQPTDQELLMALLQDSQRRRDINAMQEYARRLLPLVPADSPLQQQLRQLLR